MTLFLTAIGPVFYKLVYMSLTGLAAGAIVLLLRRLADKRFSPVWKYAMWLLVLAALVMPWRPQSRAAVLSPAEAVQDISFRDEYNRAQVEYSAALEQSPQLPKIPPELEAARREAASLRVKTLAFDELLPLLWLCGTAGVAAFMGLAAIRLRRRVQISALSEHIERYEELLERCKQRLGIKRRIRIIRQSHVDTPALLGLLRPVILLPEYAASMSNEHLEYVVLHELSHLKRGDGLVNALLLALRAVYWFNPLVWLLFKFVREDMELANDAAVLKGMGQEAQKEYSLSLVEVLMGSAVQKHGQRHTMLCMTDGKKNIERRISMIQLGEFFKKRKWIIAVAGILVIAVIAALFLTTGSYGAVRIDSALEQRIEEITQAQYAYVVYPPGFLITATKIYGAYQNDDVTRVFVTNWHSAYAEKDGSAQEGSSGIVPAAITYREKGDGTYTLIKYKEAGMGTDFLPSIRRFCRLPSGQNIRGLAQKMIDDYRDHSDLEKIRQQKLEAYLTAHDLRLIPSEWETDVSSTTDTPGRTLRADTPTETTQKPQASGELGPLTKDVFAVYTEGGTYHVKFVGPMAGGGLTTDEVYAKGGNLALMAPGEEYDRIVIKDGWYYQVSDDRKAVIKTPLADIAGYPIPPNTAYLSYVGSGKADFMGEALDYDEYSHIDGFHAFYFVKGGVLKGVRHTEDGFGDINVEYLTFDKEVPDNVFDVPAEYTVSMG